jgi:hypothetical protein
MKNSQSWIFARRQKKKFWDKDSLFFDSILRFFDVKTASSLIRLDLM